MFGQLFSTARKRTRPKQRVFERLEPRLVLDGFSLVINEFVASNGSSLLDENGQSPDWIEIYNASDATIDLDGWHLTDDDDQLTKWAFPAMDLTAGNYLTVFASGDDLRDPAGELHTNFQLDRDGEYLALVEPDGQTIAHEYAPEYPKQFDDISYGLGRDAANFAVSGGGGLKYLVPQDASLGDGWTDPAFDDSAWTSYAEASGVLVTEIGTGTPDYWEIQNASKMPVDTSGWVVLANSAQDYEINDIHDPVWTFPGSMASGELIYRPDTTNDNVFWRTSDRGWLMILDDAGGVVDFVVWGYTQQEIGDLRFDAAGFTDITVADAWGGASINTDATPFASAQRTGVADHDNASDWTFDIEPSGSAINNGLILPFELRIDMGIGFDQIGSGVGAAVQADIGSAMRGVNSSVYLRLPFDVADPTSIDTLLLSMKYNDGFAAQINGQEVVRLNAPSTLDWNSTATASRSAEDSLAFADFDLSSMLSLLRAGGNVLTIQGLNVDSADGDFLILPKLTGIARTYFTETTPGQPNVETGYAGYVHDTKFSEDRGFFDYPFDVVISTDTPNAPIYYTTDGTEPGETNGTLYTGPIHIPTTTTLRAVAIKAGYLPTDVDTQTYIFLDDVLQQTGAGMPTTWGKYVWGDLTGQTVPANYAMDPDVVNDPRYADTLKADLQTLPTISLVADPDDLFDVTNGIYVNSWLGGVAWERASSIEMFDAEGNTMFQVNAGLRMHGGASRYPSWSAKHNFRLLFKREYGPTKLEYPLFGEDATDQFDTLILRLSGVGDTWSGPIWPTQYISYLNDQWVIDTQRALGGIAPHNGYAHLYLNGLYWGIYRPIERPSAPFAASYLGGDKEDYDAINARKLIDGNWTAWTEMMGLIRSPSIDYDAVKEILDVSQFIDYMIPNQFAGNGDWPQQNWYATYGRLPGGKWHFHSWDAEVGLLDLYANQVALDPNSAWYVNGPGEIYSALRNVPEFRMEFADHLYRHMFHDGPLTEEANLTRLNDAAAIIDRAIVAESARWGDGHRDELYPPRTRDDDWIPRMTWLRETYFPQRGPIVLNQYRAIGLYPTIDPPEMNQHGGPIEPGFEVRLENPSQVGTVYYTVDGSDPRLPGGGISPTAEVFNGETTGVAMIPQGATWNYLDDGSDQGTAWYATGFNDGGWASGPAQLGYGDGDEATVVGFGGDADNKYITTYFRRTFNVADLTDLYDLTLDLLRDDGAVVYLNGQEIVRNNMAEGAFDYLTPSSAGVGGAEETTFYSYSVDTALLVQGDNVIAVEMHQWGGGSSDISFDLKLLARYAMDGSGPIDLTGPTLIKTRVLNGNVWSALNEAQFFLGTPEPLDGLAITELNYHPADPTPEEMAQGFTDSNDFEFIEFQNVGSEALELGGVQFIDGIEFAFPLDNSFKLSSIVITEAGTSTPDFIEIQNVAESTIYTPGWVVAGNDASDGNINDVHAPLWDLPASIDSGDLLYHADSAGDNIFWRTAELGWVMIVDDEGQVVDFVVWGYDADALASMDVQINGFSGNPAALAWQGAAVSTEGATSDSLIRQGSADHDSQTDWTFMEPPSGNSQNTGLTLPFAEASRDLFDPGEFVVIARNAGAFRSRYGNGIALAGQYTGGLSNGGEHLAAIDMLGRTVLDFTYGDSGDAGWPNRADGSGATLEAIDPAGDPNDPDNWRSSGEYLGSPGSAGTGSFQGIVVNEVLAHTSDSPLPPGEGQGEGLLVDAIELYNSTDTEISIGGWWLSDDSSDFLKFQIPAGTSIPAYGYVTFYEGHYEGQTLAFDPIDEFGGLGVKDFALSGARGDDVWLLADPGGGGTLRFADHVEFGSSLDGESFGRWPNETGDLYPMTGRTIDGPNSGPRIGPEVLISEVMYNAPDVSGILPENLEFIELFNMTAAPIDLTGWRLRGGFDFDFAPGTMIDSRTTLVIVAFDASDAAKLADFRGYYGIATEVQIVGTFGDRLSNTGEQIQLQRPDTPPVDDPLYVPHPLEDQIEYVDTWYPSANAAGKSLSRAGVNLWGNDQASWSPEDPTPGMAEQLNTTGVTGRYVFYNDSALGSSIATDKTALLPGGQASFANYTSYAKGINGIVINVFGLANSAGIDAADFTFKLGNDNTPANWVDAPAPASVDATGDQIVLTWNDGAIRNTWLEVTVLVTGDTGLTVPDVFYFGNLAGECTGDGKVDAADVLLTRQNPHPFFNPATIDTPYDFNRDRRVNAIDTLIARNGQTWSGTELELIDLAADAKNAGPYSPMDGTPPLNDAPLNDEFENVDWLREFSPEDASAKPERLAPRAIDRLWALFGQ